MMRTVIGTEASLLGQARAYQPTREKARNSEPVLRSTAS